MNGFRPIAERCPHDHVESRGILMTLPPNWEVRVTGDMTCAIVGGRGERILSVDMLSSGTMRAQADGDILVRTLNDLNIMASIPKLLSGEISVSQAMEQATDIAAGFSPFPWSVEYIAHRRYIVVKDGKGRRIAYRKFTASAQQSYIDEIVRVLTRGVELLSKAM